MTAIAHSGTERILRAVGKIRQDLSEVRRQSKGVHLARGIDVFRLITPMLARHGIAVASDLVTREVIIFGKGKPDEVVLTLVLVGITFQEIDSGESISNAYNGTFVGKGRHATREACIDALENALRERFLY